MTRVPHPIEVESYRILRSRLDTSDLPPYTRAVIERVIHTTADETWLDDLVCGEAALAAGARALDAGAPLVVDVTMVAAGITAYPSICRLAPTSPPASPPAGLTRAAAGIRTAVAEAGDGAVFAIGNAPTALVELLRLVASDQVHPALVIGLPVGYVGAVQAKADLRDSAVPHLSNRSAKGGAAVAAAAVNALLYPNPLT